MTGATADDRRRPGPGPEARREGIADQQGSSLETMSVATDEGVPPAGRRSSRELAEAFVRMLNEHDPAQVEQFVAVDYVNHNPFVADGRAANREFWSGFFEALPDVEVTMEDLIVSEDRVVGRFTYRGTHRGEFFGIPATGRRVEMRSIDIWRVADGAFVEHWDELNTLDLIRQFGPLALARAGLVMGARRLRALARR